MVEIYAKKATSYKVVKGRLGNRFYSDEFLQAKILQNKRERAETIA